MSQLSAGRTFRWLMVLIAIGLGSAMYAPIARAQDEAPTASDDEAAKRKSETQLQYYFRSLGIFYTIVFLSLSFTAVALVVMNVLAVRRDSIVPLHLVEGFEMHVKEKRYQEAYEMAKNDQSFMGKVLAAGLSKLSTGYAQAVEAMQEVGEEETMRLEHRLSYISLISAIAPMIGLLGTVDGMCAAFQTIANSGAAPEPRLLADNIATALTTTLMGLWIAIPTVSFFNIVKNRIARLVLEVGTLSEGLMGRFQNVGQKRA